MKNILKDNRLVINLILAIICTVVFIASLLLHYGDLKETVMVSGPLGDTFGGLFSPLIGLITILFVYRTFQDQHTSNNHSKSATNLDLLLTILERYQKDLFITIPGNLFNPAQKVSPNRLDIFVLGPDNFVFFEQLIDKLTYLTQLAESVDTFVFTNEHKAIFFNEVTIVLKQYFNIYHPITDEIQNSLQYLPDNEEASLDSFVKSETGFEIGRIVFNLRVNFYSKFLLSYYDLIERLKTLKLIQTTTIETVSAKDYYSPEPIKFDCIQRIKRTKQIDIKVTPIQ